MSRNGDWGAAQILAEEKESITIQKDIGGATTDTIKVIDDYTLGIGQTVSDIQEIAGGNYKIILASGAEFIVSRVGGRFVTKVGGKIVTWTKKQWDKVKGSYKVDGKDSAKNITNIGSGHPNPQIDTNIKETVSLIIDGKAPPKRIKHNWGAEFRNEFNDLPKTDTNGNLIKYKEYRVRALDKKPENNVHRIVVGSDGKYYYTNTHYGDVTRNGGGGIPFYEAGKLPKETINKIFKDRK